MRALIRDRETVRLRDATAAVVGPHEAAVRIHTAGICRTDLYIADGRIDVPTPMILGHEGAGTIESIRDDSAFEVGARVAINPLLTCGDCPPCRESRSAVVDCVAPRMLGLDTQGLFADVVVVPTSALIRVPAEVSLEEAAYLEPVAASMAVLQTGIGAKQRGVVLGDNRIANLTRRILELHDFVGLVSERSTAALRDLDFVIETRATETTLAEAVNALRPGGRLVLKSRPSTSIPMPIKTIVEKRLELVGARYGNFDASMALLASGRLEIDALIGGYFALESFEEAFATAREDSLHKVMFRM